ncbi:MAG TPA: cytochrome c oxidase assembly protein [Candidatus Dormibacteraeota bacterium]
MVRPAATDLTVSPVLVGALGLVVAALAWRVAAARTQGRPLVGWRNGAALLAVVLLAIAYVSPLATLAAHYLLTAHLFQVTLVMGFVPPLLLLAVDPASLRRVGWVRSMEWVVHPVAAILLVNAVFFSWHLRPLYQASLLHPDLYSVQQVSLLLVSLGFWWPIVKPGGCGRWCMGSWGKLGYILVATVPQTFAGLLFALAHRAFYTDYADAARSLGVNPLTDQQLAGACMAVLSKLALFAAFSVVLWRMLEPGGAEGDVDDDGGGGDGRDAPAPVRPGAPAWLRLLEGSRLRDEPPARRRPVTAGRR